MDVFLRKFLHHLFSLVIFKHFYFISTSHIFISSCNTSISSPYYTFIVIVVFLILFIGIHRFLPPLARQALESVLKRNNIKYTSNSSTGLAEINIFDDSIIIGSTKAPRLKSGDTSKVPDIVFYNIPQVISYK